MVPGPILCPVRQLSSLGTSQGTDSSGLLISAGTLFPRHPQGRIRVPSWCIGACK